MTAARRTPKRRRPRSRRATFAIAAACAALGAGLLVLGATAQRGLPGASHYDVRAQFTDVANLNRYAEVRIAGRRVGQVLDIAQRSGVAEATLQLDPDVRPLRHGTTARVRLKGLLGAKFIELRPAAQGAPLPDGATLGVAQTSTTDEVFDLLETFDERRRASLRSTVRGLGAGFLGRGEELNRALDAFPGALENLTATARAVNARTGAAERFAPSLDAAAAAFEPVRDDIARGLDPQARALRPLAHGRADVQHTLEAAPPALDALEDGLRRSDPLLRATTRLARSATRLTGAAPAALRETSALLAESRRPLRSARELVRLTTRAVPPALRLTRRVDPLAAPLQRLMGNGLPILAELDRRRCDVLGFGRNWRSMLAYGYPGDHPVGPENGVRVTAVASPPESEQVIADLPAITPTGGTRYPKPCALGPVPVLEGDRR